MLMFFLMEKLKMLDPNVIWCDSNDKTKWIYTYMYILFYFVAKYRDHDFYSTLDQRGQPHY